MTNLTTLEWNRIWDAQTKTINTRKKEKKLWSTKQNLWTR